MRQKINRQWKDDGRVFLGRYWIQSLEKKEKRTRKIDQLSENTLPAATQPILPGDIWAEERTRIQKWFPRHPWERERLSVHPRRQLPIVDRRLHMSNKVSGRLRVVEWNTASICTFVMLAFTYLRSSFPCSLGFCSHGTLELNRETSVFTVSWKKKKVN